MPGTSISDHSHVGVNAQKGAAAMKRYMLVLLALMLLAVPLVAGADDQGPMPPEWTPTPPARPSIDLVQVMQLLVAKGVISDQEYAQLIRPQSSSPARSGQARMQPGDAVYSNPVLSSR
jgi:hypothetical protein